MNASICNSFGQSTYEREAGNIELQSFVENHLQNGRPLENGIKKPENENVVKESSSGQISPTENNSQNAKSVTKEPILDIKMSEETKEKLTKMKTEKLTEDGKIKYLCTSL